MKKSWLVLFAFASSLSAQVQIGRGVQLGGAPGGGSGTVTNTSVAGYPSPFGTVVITNPTTTPLFTFTAPTYSQNYVLAGPTSGSGNPAPRLLVPGDLPQATSSTFGAVKPDNSTITISAGVISSTGGGGLSGQTTNCVPKANSSTTSTSSAALCDNGTTVTSSEPVAAPSYVSGTPSSGALAALPTGAHGAAMDESSTAGVPAAGVDYLRADSSSHCIMQSLNGGSETCIGAGGSFPSGNTGQILSNTSGSTTYAPQGQIVYQQAGDTIASIEANTQCATACTYIVTGPATITLSADHTLAAAVHVRFEAGGLWTVNGAHTLTFANSPTSDSLTQHLAGSSTLRGGVGSIPFEWFGVVGFNSVAGAAGGSNYTTQGQKCLDFLIGTGGWCQMQPLYYNMAGLVITNSSVGIKGMLPRDTTTGVSAIVSTSATGTIVDAHGISSAYILWNQFSTFNLIRSVQPTSLTPTDAIGFKLQFAGGVTLDTIISNDSLDHFYFNAAPFYNVGRYQFIAGFNGLLAVNSYTGSQTITQFDIDSTNGFAMNSGEFYQIGGTAVNSAASATSRVIYIHGTAINDVDFDHPESAGTSYGMVIDYTGSGGTDSDADIHINTPTFDNCLISCVKISNLPTGGGSSVTIQSGYLESNTDNTKIVDIENSNGVSIINNQIFAITGAMGVKGVYVNGAGNNSILNNKFQSLNAGNAIEVAGSTSNVIEGNTMYGTLALPMNIGIFLSSTSINNTVVGNNLGGYMTDGLNFDGTSLANDVAGNTIDTTHISVPLTGTPAGVTASFLAEPSYAGGSHICTAGNAVCGTPLPLTVVGGVTVDLATGGDYRVSIPASGGGAGLNFNPLGSGLNNYIWRSWGAGNGAGLPGVNGLLDGTTSIFVANTNTTDDWCWGSSLTIGSPDVANCKGAWMKVDHNGHLDFTAATAPTVSSCGSGTVTAGSTDNTFQITGIAATTSACTVTFHAPVQQGFCTANFIDNDSVVSYGSQDSTSTTSAVKFIWNPSASFTMTITAHCF